MEYATIYHRATDNMSYARDSEVLVISLKTGYDIERVWIYYGDPFDHGLAGGKESWTGTKAEIIDKKRHKHHLLWTIQLKPEFKRCRYYFELTSKGETIFYYEEGLLTQEKRNLVNKMPQYFTYPWMNRADINVTPDWVKNTTWYQIFPDRFCNGNSSINLEGTKSWESRTVAFDEYFGGDLEGIIQKLDYLQELGINGIYLNPIFESNSNHKYNTTDYEKIDPCFGDKEVLKDFVHKAHGRGIKIMLDGVFNHCGTQFAPWMDVLEHGTKSAYYSWFMINQWPFDKKRWDTTDGSFYSFAFAAAMPKLDTNRDEVIAYFTNICKNWVVEYDIDGIRFDVGNEVSHKFLRIMKEELKTCKPDIFLLGEIWHDAIAWLRGDEFDSVMNYPLTSSMNDFFIDKKLMSQDFEYGINRCYSMYMDQNNEVLFNLLDSHDTDRLIHRTGMQQIFYQQLVILFTMPGTPCIYYGTELVLEGAHDPDCRRCMPWQEIIAGGYQTELERMKQLIACRRKLEAFRSLQIEFTKAYEGERILEYIKYDKNGQGIRVILNCSEKPIDIKITGDILFSMEFDNIKLSPNGSLIMKE